MKLAYYIYSLGAGRMSVVYVRKLHRLSNMFFAVVCESR